MPRSPVSLCLARSSMFYGKQDLVYLGQMHFAIFGHREPSLESLKQAGALELCGVVSQPTSPGAGENAVLPRRPSAAPGASVSAHGDRGSGVWAREQPGSAQSPGLRFGSVPHLAACGLTAVWSDPLPCRRPLVCEARPASGWYRWPGRVGVPPGPGGLAQAQGWEGQSPSPCLPRRQPVWRWHGCVLPAARLRHGVCQEETPSPGPGRGHAAGLLRDVPGGRGAGHQLAAFSCHVPR